jgi:hypothetical protein
MDLPEPLTPAGCDLRDFAFMPLDVQRLRDSDLAALESPECCWSAVLLWCASWHQVPAASLPDDDRVLAQLAGFGRVVKEWQRVREGALRGWIKCADGRLYHPVVSDKACDAWESKFQQRWKSECARIKKHNQRHGTKTKFPTLDEFLSPDYRDPVPRDISPVSPGTTNGGPSDVPRETPSKRDGEGDGDGEGHRDKDKTQEEPVVVHTTAPEETPAPLPSEIAPNSRAAAISILMRRNGVEGCNSANPIVQDWAANPKVTDDLLLTAADMAKKREVLRPGPNYLAPIIAQLLNPPKPKPSEDAWRRSDKGIEGKASELGIYARPGETHDALRERCESELRRRTQGAAA